MGDAEGLLDAQLPGDLVGRPDGPETLGLTQLQRAVGARGQFGERVGRLGDGLADGGQHRGGQMGQDGEGFGFDGGADADGLAQEDGGVNLAALAFGDNFGDKHAYIIANIQTLSTVYL